MKVSTFSILLHLEMHTITPKAPRQVKTVNQLLDSKRRTLTLRVFPSLVLLIFPVSLSRSTLLATIEKSGTVRTTKMVMKLVS
jgi:hypothetical protein